MDSKEQKEFNKEECDLIYKMSCVSDAYCSEHCNMKCPYKDSEQSNGNIGG